MCIRDRPQPTTPPPPPQPSSGGTIIIRNVDKEAEYVELENRGTFAQDLTGWKIVSELGNQECLLVNVIINPGAILRVWTNNPNGDGYNCGLKQKNIWNNKEHDPAALYDAQGNLVSRFP
jgi:hypothetical protein